MDGRSAGKSPGVRCNPLPSRRCWRHRRLGPSMIRNASEYREAMTGLAEKKLASEAQRVELAKMGLSLVEISANPLRPALVGEDFLFMYQSNGPQPRPVPTGRGEQQGLHGDPGSSPDGVLLRTIDRRRDFPGEPSGATRRLAKTLRIVKDLFPARMPVRRGHPTLGRAMDRFPAVRGSGRTSVGKRRFLSN